MDGSNETSQNLRPSVRRDNSTQFVGETRESEDTTLMSQQFEADET